LDFGALPPEINSARMYAGPGVGPMLAAAVAWDGLAAELDLAASSYGSVVSGLTSGPWLGPSSLAMAVSAAADVTWLQTSAAQSAQAAAQAKAAAAAHEAAFAMTVPPPVVAANRALLMSLVATNFLGQNTPAIAATEALLMPLQHIGVPSPIVGALNSVLTPIVNEGYSQFDPGGPYFSHGKLVW